MKTVLDKVVVKELENVETTASGIVLSTDTNKDLVRGKVLSVGGDVKEIKEGDIVHFERKMGLKIKDMLVVSEKVVWGVE